MENDKLKLSIEHLDSCENDIKLAKMQKRIEEQDDLILEYQMELGVIQAWAAENASQPPQGTNTSHRLRPPDPVEDVLFQPAKVITRPTTRTFSTPSRLNILKSGRRSAVTGGQNVLGQSSAFSVMSSDINERLTEFFYELEDYSNVATYDEEGITDLCRSYRTILKKISWSGAEVSAGRVSKRDRISTKVKRVLRKLAFEIMGQLGAFRRDTEELRSELRMAHEEIRTKTLAVEAMASELDMKTNLIEKSSIFKNPTAITSDGSRDEKASEEGLASVEVCRPAPKPLLNHQMDVAMTAQDMDRDWDLSAS